MADSSSAGPARLSLTSGGGSRDGRLVISGVKAGDGNGPRVFLLSAVKAERSPSDAGGSSSSMSAGRVSLLRAAETTPGSQSKTFTADTSIQGEQLSIDSVDVDLTPFAVTPPTLASPAVGHLGHVHPSTSNSLIFQFTLELQKV